VGWRFRKRIKIAPGVNLNVSNKSMGVSAGSKYGRLSVSSSGRVTVSQSIPGTGLYNQQTLIQPPRRSHRKHPARWTVRRRGGQGLPILLRLVYFLLIGWWLTLAWWGLALVVMCTIVGLPLGLKMLAATPSVLALA
jgi:hypothetical protein